MILFFFCLKFYFRKNFDLIRGCELIINLLKRMTIFHLKKKSFSFKWSKISHNLKLEREIFEDTKISDKEKLLENKQVEKNVYAYKIVLIYNLNEMNLILLKRPPHFKSFFFKEESKSFN